MNIIKSFKNLFKTKSAYNSVDSVTFFDSTGRVIGNGSEGFSRLSQDETTTFREIEVDAFGRSPWVYIVVDRIAKMCSGVDLFLQDLNGDPISPRMRQSPRVRELIEIIKNPQKGTLNQSFSALVYEITANYLLSGNGYMMGSPFTSEGRRYNNLITPRASNVMANDNGQAGISSYNIGYFNAYWDALPIDVLHMWMPNLTADLYEGHSPMQSLLNIWKANNAVNSNEQLIHENKGSSGLFFNKSARVMSPTEREKSQEEADRIMNSRDRVGKYTILSEEIGYIDTAKSFKELEAGDSKDAHRETIAAAYNYPVVLLNDTSASAYNNVSSAEKSSYDKAALPVLDMFLKMFNQWLIADNFGLQTIKLGYDRKSIPELNLIDTEKTANEAARVALVITVQTAISDGIMTLESGINTLSMVGGFTPLEAEEVLDMRIDPVIETQP